MMLREAAIYLCPDDDDDDDNVCPNSLDGQHAWVERAAKQTPIWEWDTETCTHCGATRVIPRLRDDDETHD